MKLLVADDHPMVRAGLLALLPALARGMELLEAVDQASLLAVMAAHSDLELALVDLTMPGMEGVAGVADVRARFPAVPVVVMSGHEDPRQVRDLLATGIAGFLPKSATPDVMLAALRLVLAGGIYVPPLLLQAGAAAVAEASPAPVPQVAPAAAATDGAPRPGPASPPPQQSRPLPPRQQEILDMLALGVSNKEIARTLGVSEATVKSHLVRLFDALGVRNRTAAVALARQRAAGAKG